MLRGMWGFRSGEAPVGDAPDDALRDHAPGDAPNVGPADGDHEQCLEGGRTHQPRFDVQGIILRCRRIADLSQRDLAALLGVCPSTVARWESGSRMPPADMLAAIAEIAGCRLGLVDADDHPVATAPSETLRDRGGRRMPAHLDVHLWDEDLWEPRPSDRKEVRSIHAPRRLCRDERREALTGRVVSRAPGCVPFHSLVWNRWCHDITTPTDYIHWRATQRAMRDAAQAEARARWGPRPEPEPCSCPDECFQSDLCLPDCRCRCESYDWDVA